ncbi:MAG TPA: response regulator transcription factor [Rectinemataceae bacterium]|nr:response regulator transcription factor [Rectinemataceae bacterium]
METERILIVEDDPDIAELLSVSFRKEGWQSLCAENGERALEFLASEKLSLCVLDLMLPGMDGLAVLRAFRAGAKGSALPVIIASARGEEADVVAGLELGADDYIPKPFSPKVIIARVRALLRRSGRSSLAETAATEAKNGRLEVSGIKLDVRRHEIFASGRPIDLSVTEFAILETLMREPGRVFTRAQAIAGAKGEDYPVTDRALDVHILSLRRKLGEEGAAIETVRGVGYRFRESR